MLVLQYPMLGEDDLEFRHELEQLARAALAATNTGTCDGGDIGSGTMNVFCTVSEANAVSAGKAIGAKLVEAGIDGAVIAFIDDEDEEAEPNVLYPEDYAGTFNVL
jgi:pyridoxine 5'-phosphate synthase PdxJ